MIGWYVYLLRIGGISQVLQVTGRSADLPLVVAEMMRDAQACGAAALHGRIEAPLVEPLSRSRTLLHFSRYRMLIHPPASGAAVLLRSGDGVWSRLDGEWWIAAAIGAPTPPSSLRRAGSSRIE